MKHILYIFILIPTLIFSQVGINTTTPTKTLDVNGEMRVRELPVGSTNDYLVVADNDGNLKKILISSLNQSNNTCPNFIKSQSTGYYLLFSSNSSIPNPNDPLTIQGKNFVSAGTWISNNTYYYSYSNTTGIPININSFSVTFTTLTCTYN